MKLQKINSTNIFDFSYCCLAFLTLVYATRSYISWFFLFLLLIVSFLKIFQSDKGKVTKSPIIIAWCLYCLWVAIGLLYTHEIINGINYVLKIAVFICTLFYTKYNSRTDKTIKFFLLAVLIYEVAIFLEIIYPQLISSIRVIFNSDSVWANRTENIINVYNTRFGLFVDPTVTAFFCAAGEALAIGLIAYKKKKLGILVGSLSFIAIILTNKRGPIFVLLVTMLFFYIIQSRYSVNSKIKMLVCLLFFSAFVLYEFNSNSIIQDWLIRINSNTYSNSHRMTLYTTQWKSFLEHPFLGIGTKSATYLLNGYDGHNIYLATLCENGVIGFVLFASCLFLSIKKTYKAKKYLERNNDVSVVFINFALFMEIYIIGTGFTENLFSNLYSLSMFFFCLNYAVRKS